MHALQVLLDCEEVGQAHAIDILEVLRLGKSLLLDQMCTLCSADHPALLAAVRATAWQDTYT
eukprot:1295446-Amphidinium_carterae.1